MLSMHSVYPLNPSVSGSSNTSYAKISAATLLQPYSTLQLLSHPFSSETLDEETDFVQAATKLFNTAMNFII